MVLDVHELFAAARTPEWQLNEEDVAKIFNFDTEHERLQVHHPFDAVYLRSGQIVRGRILKVVRHIPRLVYF
jgi:hypothetical protein